MKRRTPTIWVPSRKWWPRRIGRCAASGASAERDIRVDSVCEEADDRRCRDQSSDATERGDHGRAARRGDARRGREGRKSQSQGSENGAAHGGPHAEVARSLGRNGVRDRREDEARGGDQNERAREHEVVEALALPETPVDEVRDQEGDERRRRLKGDVELRARVGEREARDEARRRRQRGRGPGEAQGEEPKAHSKEGNRHSEPFRLAFTKINARAARKARY